MKNTTEEKATHWRITLHAGKDGEDMWPKCFAQGVAAITFRPLNEVDLSAHAPGEPEELWAQLKPAQKNSLKAIAYEMKEGDIIYVKQGPHLVGRGVVTGSYQFDSQGTIVDQQETPWPHQVPVEWERNFLRVKLLLGSEQAAVKKFTPENIAELDKALGKS